MNAITLAERGLLPDWLLRLGIRRLCQRRLQALAAGTPGDRLAVQQALLDSLRASPVAIEVAAANAQHYELPPAFFQLCLGPRLKYSACLFEQPDSSLAQAEEAMLRLYGERAGLAEGQRILELGCGWGSLTLWMAERFPAARITAVSNSASQREHILARCAERGFGNVEVVTRDVNHLELPAASFDRVVSIEMFEHMRNYRLLLQRISRWLAADGALFVHIFCHRDSAYPFETEGGHNWMGRYFFTGGLMPAFDTLAQFQDDLALQQCWRIDGRHYQRTAEAWLANHDRAGDQVLALMRQTYGEDQAQVWNQRWRMFWLACAETFGYRGGKEWLVGHYLFTHPSRS